MVFVLTKLYVSIGAERRALDVFEFLLSLPKLRTTDRAKLLFEYCHCLIRLGRFDNAQREFSTLKSTLSSCSVSQEQSGQLELLRACLLARYDFVLGGFRYPHTHLEQAERLFNSGMKKCLPRVSSSVLEALAFTSVMLEYNDKADEAVARINASIEAVGKSRTMPACQLRILNIALRLIQNLYSTDPEKVLPIAAGAFSLAERLRLSSPASIILQGNLEPYIDHLYEQAFGACVVLQAPDALSWLIDLTRGPALRQTLSMTARVRPLLARLMPAYRAFARHILAVKRQETSRWEMLWQIDSIEAEIRLAQGATAMEADASVCHLTFGAKPTFQRVPDPPPTTLDATVVFSKLCPPLDVDQLQGFLSNDTAVIQYGCRGEISCAVVVRKSCCRLFYLEIAPERPNSLHENEATLASLILSGCIERFESMSADILQDTAEARLRCKNALRTLYRTLFAPLLPYLTGIERAIVIPDGPIQYVPFEALICNDSAPDDDRFSSCTFLGERLTFQYVPTGSVLPLLKQIRAAGQPTKPDFEVVILSEPLLLGTLDCEFEKKLLGARREGRALSALYKRAGKAVSHHEGLEATKDRCLQAARRCKLLHLATHCKTNRNDIWLSRLMLAGESKRDPLLDDLWAYEIRQSQFVCELVVCSACETESGQYVRGEGLLGLARAFFEAGVPSIIGTMWRVDDEVTCRFMVSFHRNLLNVPIDLALREARKRIIKRQPDPFFWSPFVLLGVV